MVQLGHGEVGKHRPGGDDSDTEDEQVGAGNSSGGLEVPGPGNQQETLD